MKCFPKRLSFYFFSVNRGEEMLCKPQCSADICLLPSRRQGGFKIFQSSWERHILEYLHQGRDGSIFPWKFSARRHEVRGDMNENFREDFNQGRFGACGCLDLPLKKGERKIKSTSKYLRAYRFFSFWFFLLKLILALIKFFIKDTVLGKAIVRFFAMTLKFLCCDSC